MKVFEKIKMIVFVRTLRDDTIATPPDLMKSHCNELCQNNCKTMIVMI